MGSTNEVTNLGLEYTDVIYSGSIIFISVVALNSLLHAEGDTKTFRNVLILSFILNIVFCGKLEKLITSGPPGGAKKKEKTFDFQAELMKNLPDNLKTQVPDIEKGKSKTEV